MIQTKICSNKIVAVALVIVFSTADGALGPPGKSDLWIAGTRKLGFWEIDEKKSHCSVNIIQKSGKEIVGNNHISIAFYVVFDSILTLNWVRFLGEV